jgi:auxin efflux carrier family protein
MGVLCDPIFWVVCWLLVGSPTAVQLTQITQLNGVFEGEMATVLTAPFPLSSVIGSDANGF